MFRKNRPTQCPMDVQKEPEKSMLMCTSRLEREILWSQIQKHRSTAKVNGTTKRAARGYPTTCGSSPLVATRWPQRGVCVCVCVCVCFFHTLLFNCKVRASQLLCCRFLIGNFWPKTNRQLSVVWVLTTWRKKVSCQLHGIFAFRKKFKKALSFVMMQVAHLLPQHSSEPQGLHSQYSAWLQA